MTSGEIAALVTAFGISLAAILTSIAALINARNSKDIVERLRTEIVKLQDHIAKLKEHNIQQDTLLVMREAELDQVKRENAALNKKIELWQEWGQTVGRKMNEMQLMIGYLTQWQADNDAGTAPLPSRPGPTGEG